MLALHHPALLAAALLAATVADAQTTYRWTDKDTGQTFYSDKAPPPGARQVVRSNNPEAVDDQPLPYATRQAAEKFPVTLYTAGNCGDPCKQARALLNGRGIPFTEKMLKSEEELAELAKTLGSDAGVPSLFVGQQHLKGLEYGAWNSLLDLAGYPRTPPYGARPSGSLAK